MRYESLSDPVIVIPAMVYDLAVELGVISKSSRGYYRLPEKICTTLNPPKPQQPSGWYQKFNKRKNK